MQTESNITTLVDDAIDAIRDLCSLASADRSGFFNCPDEQAERCEEIVEVIQRLVKQVLKAGA